MCVLGGGGGGLGVVVGVGGGGGGSEAELKCLSLTAMILPLLCVGKRKLVYLSVNVVVGSWMSSL